VFFAAPVIRDVLSIEFPSIKQRRIAALFPLDNVLTISI
jgi:hypothetical protein